MIPLIAQSANKGYAPSNHADAKDDDAKLISPHAALAYFPNPSINTSVIVPYSDSRSVAMISARSG